MEARGHGTLGKGCRMEAMGKPDNRLTAKVRKLAKEHGLPQTAAKFSALGHEAVPILCSLVAEEAGRRRRMRWFFVMVMLAGIAAKAILHYTLPGEISELYEVMAIGVQTVGSLGLVLMFYGGRATKLLAALDDARMVGPLLDAILVHSRDGHLKSPVREALTRLLPRLKASDMAHGLPRHITALNKEIDFCRAWKWGAAEEVAYALIVLQALEQVGDESSVPVVEQVLQTTKNDAVRHAAEACLPFLRQRAATGKNTLLRAAPPASTDLLLPAQSVGPADPNVLLRSVSSGENR